MTVTGSPLPEGRRTARWLIAGIGMVAVGAGTVLCCWPAGPAIRDCSVAAVRVVEGAMRDVDSHVDRFVRTVTFEVVATVRGLGSEPHLYGEIRFGPAGPFGYLSSGDFGGVARSDDAQGSLGAGGVRIALDLMLFEQPEGNNLGVKQFVAMLADRVPMAVHVRAAQGEQVLAESEWMDTGAFRDGLLAQLRAK